MTAFANAASGNTVDRYSPSSGAATTQQRSADIIDFPVSAARLALTQPYVDWANAVQIRLNHICQLPLGWDGYRGRPTRFDVAYFTFEMLRRVCRPTTPTPSIVPLPSGGLQVEWHDDQADIELTVRAPCNVEAWVADPSHQDDGIEQLLTTNFAFIVPWVNKLG